MKTKSYAALLLTTAFLVGCGDGGSSSNNQATPNKGTNTSINDGVNPNSDSAGSKVIEPNVSNKTVNPSAATEVVASTLKPTVKPEFDPKALVAKVATLEQLEALPEYKQLETWLTPYRDRINDKTLSGLDRSAEKLQYISDYREVYYAQEDLKSAAMEVMLKSAAAGRSLEIPTADKSWAEMADYVEFRHKLSAKLEEQDNKLNRFNLPRQIELLGILYSEADRDINAAIDATYKLQPPSFNNTFQVYRNTFGIMLIEKPKISAYVDGRFQTDRNYPSVVESIKTVLRKAENNGRRYDMANITDEGVITVLKNCATSGCCRNVFSPNHDKYPLLERNIPLGNLADQPQEGDQLEFTEKLFIAEMIKSGNFGTLFQYLRGKEVSGFSGEMKIFFTETEYDALVAFQSQKKLAAGISPSALPSSFRKGINGRVDATQLQINGVSAGKVAMGLPLMMNLKGKIDGSKSTAGTSGSVAYKIGNTVVGVVHAYANAGDGFEIGSHQAETSVALSQSFGSMFVEAQMGFVNAQQVHSADMLGGRYQLTLGFDTEYVSPFVQVAYRDLGTQTDTAGYVGAEVSIESLKVDSYSLDLSMISKAGYDSNKAWVGSLEWSAGLSLNDGVSVKTDLSLGTHEGPGFGIRLDMSR